MSFWSTIYAGDAAQIAHAFFAGEQVESLSFVAAHVDLPGILPGDGELANSPDLLTELACTTLGIEPLTFAGSIEQDLGTADANDGAYVMAAPWVALFAQLTDQQSGFVGRRWLQAIDPGSTQVAASIAAITTMVQQISAVCRVAKQRETAVIYAWTL